MKLKEKLAEETIREYLDTHFKITVSHMAESVYKREEMTAEERAKLVLDEWPNLYMECDVDEVADDIVKHIKEAIQEEREACAKVCEDIYSSNGYAPGDWPTPEECAQAIRARGEK